MELHDGEPAPYTNMLPACLQVSDYGTLYHSFMADHQQLSGSDWLICTLIWE